MKSLYNQIALDIYKCKNLYMCVFISTVIVGIVTHLYVLTNKFFNIDDIIYIGQTEIDHTSTGRWFLGLCTKLTSDYSMPWVIGFVTIFTLSLTALAVCAVLKIHHYSCGVLIGALLITYPSIAGNFGYMFLADGYAEGIFLSVMGVYFLRMSCLSKRATILKNGLSIICFTLSLSIYQAYICFAVGLINICLISDCFKEIQNKTKWICMFKRCLNYLSILIIAFLVYLSTVFISLRLAHTELSSYQNINNATVLSIQTIMQGIFNAYISFFLFIQTKDYGNYNQTLFTVHIGMLFTLLWSSYHVLSLRLKIGSIKTSRNPEIKGSESNRLRCWFINLRRKITVLVRRLNFRLKLGLGAGNGERWGGGIKYIILIILILILPATIESIYIIAAQGNNLHLLTKYARVLWYVAYIALIDAISYFKIRREFLYRIAAILTGLAIFQNYLVCNICYYRMQITYNSIYSMLTRMAVRIEECPGFTKDSAVWIVVDDENPALSKSLVQGFSETRRMTGISLESDLILSEKSIYRIMRGYIHLEYQLPQGEQREAVKSAGIIPSMPLYPHPDSIQWIEGVLVLKVSGERKEN